ALRHSTPFSSIITMLYFKNSSLAETVSHASSSPPNYDSEHVEIVDTPISSAGQSTRPPPSG
ncbi:hypothetical protein Ciccas_011780, partial [Cichlidogyrus casuarinus]